MGLVSIADAAGLVGRDRKTLYRAIVAGRLSATVDANGAKQVDVSELMRVYGPIGVPCHKDATVAVPQDETPDATGSATDATQAKVAVLEAENAQLRARLDDKDQRLADKDRHIDDLRASIRLLENKVQKADTRPWLLRMFR